MSTIFTKDYITSERFIHDGLIEEVALMIVPEVRKRWRANKGKIATMIFTWPSEEVLADDGHPIKGTCCLEVPDTMTVAEATRLMVHRTNAYALVLVEDRGDKVQVIFESPHGTKSWTSPIVRKGDVRALGTSTEKIDTDSIGLLWNKNKARA